MHLDPTQQAGIAAFGLAALASALAARRGSGWWRLLAVAQAACALEVVLGLRHRLHDAVDRLLQLHGWYGERAAWQLGALAIGTLLLVGGTAAAAWRRPALRETGPGAAFLATVGTLAVFGIESISLHATDVGLYTSAGPVRRIAWVWIMLAAVGVIGALQQIRRGDAPAAFRARRRPDRAGPAPRR